MLFLPKQVCQRIRVDETRLSVRARACLSELREGVDFPFRLISVLELTPSKPESAAAPWLPWPLRGGSENGRRSGASRGIADYGGTGARAYKSSRECHPLACCMAGDLRRAK